ncbi:MAG TPA: hypothetical protein VK081_01960 [Planctomycetota bacterium]|nr:hypothetical protein [Planctomycetota bacterium]
MPYMLAPGARLYVGPRGQMEESLGACCAPCAQGRPCASLGAVDKSGNAQPSLKMLARQNRTITDTLVPAGAGGGLRGALPYLAGGAVLLVGAAVILRRNRKR